MRRIYDIFKDGKGVRDYMFGKGTEEEAVKNINYLCWKYGEDKTLNFLEGYNCVETAMVLEGAVTDVKIAYAYVGRYNKKDCFLYNFWLS